MRWPDLLIDFGREAYIPWRLAMGDTLYADIVTVNGPLAYVVVALAFVAFGDSLLVLALVNMAVTVIFTNMAHTFIRRSCDMITANMAALIFLVFFAFSHFTIVGNYNWIMPYSMAYTLGVALCMAMLLCLQPTFATLDRRLALLAGTMLGLVAFTRIEVLLAGCVAAIVYFMLVSFMGIALRKLLFILASFMIGIFFGLFVGLLITSPFMDINLWLDELLLPLRFVAKGGVETNIFFLRLTGLIDPPRYLLEMLKATLYVLTGIAICLGSDRVLRSLPARPLVRWLCVFAILAVAATSIQGALLFHGKAFTFMAALLTVAFFLKFLADKKDLELRLRYGSIILLAVFGIGMLAKLPLNPGFAHVGFVMGAGAGIAMIVASVWAPQVLLYGNWKPSAFFMIMICGALLIDCYSGFKHSNQIYNFKVAPLSSNGDTLYGFPFEIGITRSAPYVQQIINQLEALMEENDTLAVLPEGITINYLMRRKSSVPYVFFLPTVINRRGESIMIESFDQAPPDFIAIIPKNPAELGVGFFGKDPRNGMALMNWIRENYEIVYSEQQTGNRPAEMLSVIYRHTTFKISNDD